MGCQNENIDTPPLASDGIIDISSWDFKAKGSVELNGEWRFVWNKFLDFETIEANWDNHSTNLEVPGNWSIEQSTKEPSTIYNRTGFGTYFLRLKLGEQNLVDVPRLTLRGKSLCYAATLEVWDEKTGKKLGSGESGRPATNVHQERATMNLDGVVSWDHLQNHSILLIVRISNHVHARPGILSPPTLGIATVEDKLILREFLVGAGVSGILIIIALYHFILFLQRRDDKLSFTFALLCCTVAAREILTSGIFESLSDPLNSSVFQITARLEYLTMPVICSVSFMYFATLYRDNALTWIGRIWGYGFGSILVILCLSQPSLVFTDLAYIFHLQLVVTMLVLAVHVLRAFFQKRDLANWVLFSLIIVLSGFTNDLLYSKHIVEIGYIGPYCFLLFILIQSAIIAKRFAKAMDERDLSNKALLETYRQLDRELQKREDLIATNDALGTEIEAASQQLIQADKLSSLGQLVAGVAHEIAGPTNYIGLAIQLIHQRVESVRTLLLKILDPNDHEAKQVMSLFSKELDDAKEEIARIGSGVEKIQGIHSALRNHGRVDPMPTDNLEFDPILDETLIILGSKTKLIETQIDTNHAPLFTGRRSQISQVLTNLLGNAADAVEEKRLEAKENGGKFEPKILIQAKSSTQNNRATLEVAIHDNGNGIPVEIRERILQPFFTTKEVGKGTGLGMPIIMRIIQSHGGSLEISDSEPLGGACLIFSIPCEAPEQPDLAVSS